LYTRSEKADDDASGNGYVAIAGREGGHERQCVVVENDLGREHVLVTPKSRARIQLPSAAAAVLWNPHCFVSRALLISYTMRPEKFLRDLLAQPFGPYLEETILSDKCKFVQTRRLLLEDFQLAHNNEPTG